jgi:tRNA threonylcarbamoyladenosine biosynthesis protein TsaE
VTVVEWGEGLAEGLAEDRLEIVITPRRDGGSDTGDDLGDGDAPRTVSISGVGSRWRDIQLPPAEVANRL